MFEQCSYRTEDFYPLYPISNKTLDEEKVKMGDSLVENEKVTNIIFAN